MLIQIRNSVFETNSSSMHTLAIKKNHHKLTEEDLKHEYCGISIGSNGVTHLFDFECSQYDTESFIPIYRIYDKIKYIIYRKSLRAKSQEELIKWIEENIYPVIKKYYPKFVKINIDGFDCDSIYNKDKEDYLIQYLKDNNISIEDFITDTSYCVFTDTDNDSVLFDLMRVEIFHEDDYDKLVRIW